MTWTAIKAFLSRAWNAIKQVPHWALIAIMSLLSAAVYFANASSRRKKLLQIQKDISNIEKERAEAISSIETESREEEAEISRAYKEKIEVLEQEEKEIKEAEVEGPVAIAEKWTAYLSTKKDKK